MLIRHVEQREKDRMDMFHAMFLTARKKKLHRAPITEPPPDSGELCRILDLGTGTGIWAIDMADLYPFAEVIGTDVVNIQPPQIPPNLRFRVPRDYESSVWSLGENSFDLIHMRMGCGGVSQWLELYPKIFYHLKPGMGHFEQVEIDLTPRCDDGPPPPMLEKWYDWLRDATYRGSKPLEYPAGAPQTLRGLGFTDVREEVIRLPLSTWATGDRLQQDIGRWYNLGFSEGVEALCLGPFTRVYKWPLDDVKKLIEEVKREANSKKNRVYHNLHIITARKPG